jgi:hypothetical protein
MKTSEPARGTTVMPGLKQAMDPRVPALPGTGQAGDELSPAVRARLVKLWCPWERLVALFALSRRERKKVRPQEYELVYSRLLEECEQLAGEQPQGQMLCRQMVDLVRPWLSCESFAQANEEILADLLDRCRAMSTRLGVKDDRGRLWRGLLWGFLVIVAATAAGLLLLFGREIWWSGWNWVRAQGVALPTHRIDFGAFTPWIIPVALGVLVVMYLVSRTRRY